MKNNKGFSLLEMLVAVSIASGIGVAVMGFMSVGAQSFRSSGTDVNVQNEAQLVFNQIQELVVDANVGADFGPKTIKIKEVKEDGTITEAEHSYQALTLINYDANDADRHVCDVLWEDTTEQLFYTEYEPILKVEGEEKKVEWNPNALLYDPPQLLGENVTDFKVDLSDMVKKRVVRLDLTLQKGKKSYRSSHNITLRNEIVNGGKIPEYMETPSTVIDPDRVTGETNLYAEPGDTIDMAGVGGYKVLAPGGTDYPDQDIRFFLAGDGSAAGGTNVSTSGSLSVSKAQKDDFYVTVATRTGKGKALKVKINMIVVDSVAVHMVPGSRDDDKADGDPLEQRVSFKLEAVVNGRNLDMPKPKADGGKADAGTIAQRCAITWALASGAEQYVTQGAASATANGSVCSFTMKDNFTIGNKDGKAFFSIVATSRRSVDKAYCIGDVPTPVVGMFTGTASVEKGDFTIVTKADSILRGKHTPFQNCFSIVNDITDEAYKNNKSNYITFVSIKINELRYQPEETVPSNKYQVVRDVRNSKNRFQGEGSALGIFTPDITEADPNTAFEYEMTLYVFKKHQYEWRNEGNLYVYPLGETNVDGYDMEHANYKSNMITFRCERLLIYYKDPGGFFQWPADENRLTANVTPRAIGNDGYFPSEKNFKFEIQEGDNVEANGVQNKLSGGTGGFKILRQEGDKWLDDWVDCADGQRFSTENQNGKVMAVYKDGGLSIKFKYNDWDDRLPQMVRIVPYVKYTDGTGTHEGIFFDNYVNVYLWNIELPTYGGYKTKLTTSGGYLSRGYLPSVMDPVMQPEAKNNDQRYYIKYKFSAQDGDFWYQWKYPYAPNVIDVSGNISSDKVKEMYLRYAISCNKDAGGNPQYYYLKVERITDAHQWVSLGYYMCRYNEREWKTISYDEYHDQITGR